LALIAIFRDGEKRYIDKMLRLKKIRKASGLTQAEIAAKLGIDLTNYNRLENGKVNLTYAKMKDIADILGVDPKDLISDDSKTIKVRVRAHVEAGVWAESYEWPEDDWYEVAIPASRELEGVNLYGAETRGSSMNKVYPEGTILIFTPLIESQENIKPGKRYIVQRERADGLREDTVKTLFLDDTNKLWLMPESTDPRHQQPIELTGENGDSVRIVGRVLYSFRPE
jgi:transcriptional regulator with XRE-family HTH domain